MHNVKWSVRRDGNVKVLRAELLCFVQNADHEMPMRPNFAAAGQAHAARKGSKPNSRKDFDDTTALDLDNIVKISCVIT